MKPRVLVTDGEQRAALAVVRSLGRAGFDVVVCATRKRSLAGASRHADRHLVVPDALADPAGFAAAIAAACVSERIDVLLPIAEPSMLALLGPGAIPSGTNVPFPSLDTFRRLSDKALLLEVAARIGIAVPAQRVLRSPADLEEIGSALPFPLVLKPSRSVGEAGGERLKLGVGYAADPGEFRRAVGRLPAQAFPLLLQQRVVGPGIGIFLLRWRGERVAVFAHRRIREKPPAGGVSVYRESVPAEPGLVDLSERLLDEFGWDGVAMVEFKLDAATGTPYLMEVNGRFWGSLQLAVDAGVDFPRLLVECAMGHAPKSADRYRVGVRSRWWWGDFDHLLARLRRSSEELALPPGSPGRRRAIGDFLTLWRRGDRNEVLRVDDPMPAVQETRDWLRGR